MLKKLKILKIVRFFSSPSVWLYKLLPVCLIVIGIIINFYAVAPRMSSQNPNKSPSVIPKSPSTATDPNFAQSLGNTSSTDTPNSSDTKTLPKFGHLPYVDADVEKLIVISSYGQHEYLRFERLMPDAAFALMKMMYAARDDGVWIIPSSGFRDYDIQKELFNKQIQIKGSVKEAAKSVAPAGYSEHHTGYAVDLVDGYVPNTDISSSFVETKAFQWLMQRANEFGYELSFQENNNQGVKYEPWHWRFINSPEAIAIFKNVKD